MASYVPFLFVLLALLAQANGQNNASVSVKACQMTMFKDLCFSTFEALPEARKGDLVGLTSTALTTVTRQALAINAHIQLLSKKTVDETIKLRLNDCASNYGSAIDGLKKSAEALVRRSFNDVNTYVSAAMSEAGSCEDGIAEVRTSLPRLSPLNKKFNDLCSILLTFSNLCASPVDLLAN